MKIQNIKVNNDRTKIVINYQNGFGIYTINNLKLEHQQFFDYKISNVTLLSNTSKVIYTGTSNQNSLSDKNICVFDYAENKMQIEIETTCPVYKILVTDKSFILSSKSETRVYNFDPPELYINHHHQNEYSPCDILHTSDLYLVGVTGSKPGNLKIINLNSREDIETNAASHQLSYIKFSNSGSLVATTSSQGTLIRLFNTNDLSPLKEFRRGSFPASIFSIDFSFSSNLIGILSSKDTLHLFSVSSDNQRSGMKWKKQSLGNSIFAFIESNKILVISNNGEVIMLSYDENFCQYQKYHKVHWLQIIQNEKCI